MLYKLYMNVFYKLCFYSIAICFVSYIELCFISYVFVAYQCAYKIYSNVFYKLEFFIV